MLPILHETDCPQDSLRGWTLAVLGYGNQGRAHALNLRDSGYTVLVSGRPGGEGTRRAAADGFACVALAETAQSADLVAILTPDQTQRAQVEALTQAARGGGRTKALVFAHGFALRFDPPLCDPAWDVLVVAPAGPGVQLRGRYVEGRGIPALLAVHQNGSGAAAARAGAYAAAIGCARAGCLPTTVGAEAEVDLFGEQAVLCGGMNALCRAAFEILVEAGYAEEMAYLECVHQLRLTAELVEQFGVDGMRRRISPTALYGDLTRGGRVIDAKVRERMAEILDEIRIGSFAREWLDMAAARPGWREAELDGARNPALERAGDRIRELFAEPPPGAAGTGAGRAGRATPQSPGPGEMG